MKKVRGIASLEKVKLMRAVGDDVVEVTSGR